jgi:hypothetical protein
MKKSSIFAKKGEMEILRKVNPAVLISILKFTVVFMEMHLIARMLVLATFVMQQEYAAFCNSSALIPLYLILNVYEK